MEKNVKEKLINEEPEKMQMNKIQGLSFNVSTAQYI